MLSAPAVEFEYLPAPLWENLKFEQYHPVDDLSGATQPGDILKAFHATVDEATNGAETVAVLFSGGLDSLAVLCHAHRQCQNTDRRLVTSVINISDDDGVKAADVAARLIRDFSIDTELIVTEPRSTECRTRFWSIDGPSFVAMPLYVRAAVDSVRALGSEVLLDGSGGDETMQFPGFGSGTFACGGDLKALCGYLKDTFRYDAQAAVLGEFASSIAKVLPRPLSSALYHSFHLTDLARLSKQQIVSAKYRELVDEYVVKWYQHRITWLDQLRGSWTKMALLDQIHPIEPVQDFGLPIRSPFLQIDFVKAALRLPSAARYSHGLKFPYHRWKSITCDLLPPECRKYAPRYKQLYRTSVAEYRSSYDPRKSISVNLGIARPEPFTDSRIRRAVINLDNWLNEAIRRGINIVD
jgi:asparagine synthetase B (glutamine-hydrolysing)